MSEIARRLFVVMAVFATAILPAAAQAPAPGVDTPPQGQYAAIEGMKMYYEVHGQGEPLVLLHGFNGSGQAWRPFVEEFAKTFRVIVPDLRGHGRTSNPTGQFTHRRSAMDIYALLDRLGVQRFKAMGISTGGMTLLHMATQQPARAEAVVLIGATSYFPEQAREIMRKMTPEPGSEKEWERARQIHKLGDDQIRALRRQFHQFKDSYDDMNFTAPYLSTITARTLIIHGDRDAFFPVNIPVEQYRSIPKAYLWIVPNGGHVPIGQHREEFVKVAGAFLRGEWEQRPQ